MLEQSQPRVKTLLQGGGFEDAVRAAGFQRLVCVGNATVIVRMLLQGGHADDPHATILRLLQDSIRDPAWYRGLTENVGDATRRALEIDTRLDWWWADDLAAEYCAEEGLSALFQAECPGRICVPEPDGDGADLLAWLRAIPAR